MLSISKVCNTCSISHPQEFFVKSNLTKSGYRGICKTCFNAYYAKRRIDKYDKVREYEKKFHRARRLKYAYNITEDQLHEMKVAQDGCCAICKSPEKLVIDHCHSTGVVRGLLCNTCNIGLGHFKDEVSRMKSAIAYLEKEHK